MPRSFAVNYQTVNQQRSPKAAKAVISMLALLIAMALADYIAGTGASTYDDQRHSVSS